MMPQQASRTAEFMAFFRALESVRPARQRLFADPYAYHFLGPSLRKVVRLARVPVLGAFVYWCLDHFFRGADTSAIARTRLIDEVWSQALHDGIRQIVILGAGFDCRAYRMPESRSATVFEADHPTTLAAKLQGLNQAIPVIPANVRFVEIDFNRQSLPEVLAEAGFDASLPALFVWEGVTNYLTPDAVDSMLRYLGSRARGSRVVFTYVDRGALDGSVHFEGAAEILRDVARLGEPWTCGFSPGELPDLLRGRGLELDRDAGAREYRAQYLGRRAQNAKGYEFYHVAVARVVERSI
jgi:methyltransferase (TIGR00027 family)